MALNRCMGLQDRWGTNSVNVAGNRQVRGRQVHQIPQQQHSRSGDGTDGGKRNR